MNPQSVFCPHPDCPLAGETGAGNVVIHSRKEERYRCKACRRTFSARQGTVFYRKKTPVEVVTVVLTLLAYGCPVPAVVAAFGIDERTVAAWLGGAGSHCQAVHERLVQSGQLDLEHVQADELWVKRVGGKLWLAMAVCVRSRLWLGGVLSERRDTALARAVAGLVRSCGKRLSLLVTTDGWKPYQDAFLKGFRFAVKTGRRGRPRLVLEEGFLLGQVVKQYAKRRVTAVTQRFVRGAQERIEAAGRASGGGTGVNTAYIERLNPGPGPLLRIHPRSAAVWLPWRGAPEASPARRRRFGPGCIWSAVSTTSVRSTTRSGRPKIRHRRRSSGLRRWRQA